jgi:CRP-like cAMP-binding protein
MINHVTRVTGHSNYQNATYMTGKFEMLKAVYAPLVADKSVLEQLISAHEEKRYCKGSILLQEADIMDCYYIIDTGIVRSYIMQEDGESVTVDFFISGDIAFDVVSLFQQKPSNVYLQCITDITCRRLKYDSFKKLYAHLPGFSEWGRGWMTEEYCRLRERTLKMVTQKASQRYHELSLIMPEIHREVPLKYIASYLGVTDTSLSRLRRHKLRV